MDCKLQRALLSGQEQQTMLGGTGADTYMGLVLEWRLEWRERYFGDINRSGDALCCHVFLVNKRVG